MNETRADLKSLGRDLSIKTKKISRLKLQLLTNVVTGVESRGPKNDWEREALRSVVVRKVKKNEKL